MQIPLVRLPFVVPGGDRNALYQHHYRPARLVLLEHPQSVQANLLDQYSPSHNSAPKGELLFVRDYTYSSIRPNHRHLDHARRERVPEHRQAAMGGEIPSQEGYAYEQFEDGVGVTLATDGDGFRATPLHVFAKR